MVVAALVDDCGEQVKNPVVDVAVLAVLVVEVVGGLLRKVRLRWCSF